LLCRTSRNGNRGLCSASSPLRPNEGLHERRISGSS
jgi:hypothetical protein